MVDQLTFSYKVQCTVLEVKVVEGHGTTIDVVLVNGVLHEGDQIVICGMQDPIVTSIRALLTPHPMRELRVKGTYLHHKEIKASQGIKIAAQGLEHVVAGGNLYVVGPDEDIEEIKNLAMEEKQSVLSMVDKSGKGVCAQASTPGSAEALLGLLASSDINIPVRYISIGPVYKKDVKQAMVMLEKKKEYATILAFDVKVTPDAQEYADGAGVKIFTSDVIYHLFEQFKAYIDNIREKEKSKAAVDAVFPCRLQILNIFNQKAPILIGVKVLEGTVKIGTPICVPARSCIDIGHVASMEINHNSAELAERGQEVAIKIVGSNTEEQQILYGRHFDLNDVLVSRVSRKSIDAFVAIYRDDSSITEEIWKLLHKLKLRLRI